jgi:hypothetical protein
MMIGVSLCRLAGMVLGVQIMGVREMAVMARRLMVAARRVLGRLAMVMGGALMMFGGVLMVLCRAFGVSHGRLLVSARILRTFLLSAILRQKSDAAGLAPRNLT